MFEQNRPFGYLKLAYLHAMSENTNTKQPPLMGFWPHEVAIIALLFWTLSTATEQRGTNRPEIFYAL